MANSAFTQNPNVVDATTATNLTGFLKGNGSTVTASATVSGSEIVTPLTLDISDAGTANTVTPLTLRHTTSGTAGTGYGVALGASLENSSGAYSTAGSVGWYWDTATAPNPRSVAYLGTGGGGFVWGKDTVFGNQLGFYNTNNMSTQQNQVDIPTALNNVGLTSGYCTIDAARLRGLVPRNPIDNATFTVWQRGNSFTNVASGQYTADRWAYGKTGTMVHTIALDTSVPGVAVNSSCLTNQSFKATITTTDTSIASTDYCLVTQSIEGLNWITYAQQPFTLSFWMRSNVNGTYCVSLRNSGGDRSFVAECGYTGGDTWQYFNVQVPASPSAGTWNYATGVGLSVSFVLCAGSSFQTTPGSWNTGNLLATSNQVNNCGTSGATFYLSQVMITPGWASNASNGVIKQMYQPVPVHEELARCYRYYQNWAGYIIGIAFNVNDTYTLGTHTFPTMRQGPTAAAGTTYSVNAGAAGTVLFGASTTSSGRWWNGSANWTTNAIIYIGTGGLTADL